MLYQRVTGDFYTINSEGKFTLPRAPEPVALFSQFVYNRYIPIIDKGIFGQSRAVSASCCVAFHSAYVQYASFKRLAGRRNSLCLTL